MNLTREQSCLLSAAVQRPDMLMLTAAGSPNDDVWRALVDRGMLEAVTEFKEPQLRDMVEGCDLRAYRVRPHVAERAAAFKQASHPAGNA